AMPNDLKLPTTFLFFVTAPFTFGVATAADKPATTFTSAKDAGTDYQIQGEYTGSIAESGKQQKVGVQIVALGQGKFALVLYPSGLPGDGWDKSKESSRTSGELKDSAAIFAEGDRTFRAADGKLEVKSKDQKIGELSRVERKSATLGAKPPAGAI